MIVRTLCTHLNGHLVPDDQGGPTRTHSDFLRPQKWDDERVASLLATVALGYPTGVVMTPATGGSGLRFKPRPLADADLPAKVAHYDTPPVNLDEKQNLERRLRYMRWLSSAMGA